MSDAPVLDLLPAVDVADGGAVRLVRGEADSATTHGDALDVALGWQEAGAEWIHLVDLDAAFGRGSNRALLDRIVDTLDVSVEVSGGICDEESLAVAFRTGCERVVLSTDSLANLEWIRSVVGRCGDRVAVGLDVRGSTLCARGSNRDGGELWPMLARLDAEGCARYVITDVSRDGTLGGPNIELLRDLCDRAAGPVIASGGISSLDDLAALRALVPLGVEGAIVGKALYAGAFTFEHALDVAGRR